MVEGSPHMWLMCMVINVQGNNYYTTIWVEGRAHMWLMCTVINYYMVEGSSHVWLTCKVKWSTSSAPPLQFTKQQPTVRKDQDPGTTQPEGNLKSVKNVYSKTYTVTTIKKLGSTFPLFSTFYTSPASISTNKYHLLYKQTSDQFSTWHGAQPRRTRKPEMVHLINPPLQFTKHQPKV